VPKGTFRSIVTDIASGLAGCVLAVCAVCSNAQRCGRARTQ
jgi:hypothetical protein